MSACNFQLIFFTVLMCFCQLPFLSSISLLCHFIFQMCFVPSVNFQISSSIKGPIIKRTPPSRLSLWALTHFFPWPPAILPGLLSLLCRELKGKNLKIWILVLIHYPLRSLFYTPVFRCLLHQVFPIVKVLAKVVHVKTLHKVLKN